MTDPTVVAATFRNRDDAHRAVIELREVEFPADSIGAAYRQGPGPQPADSANLPPDHPIVSDAAAPNTTSSETAAAVLPDTPITSLTGGSPFGEASTYRPHAASDEQWWEGMRVAFPSPRQPDSPANPGTRQARKTAPPTDTNFEPADRPAPAYDNDYEAGDYTYETFDPATLEQTLAAYGLPPDHARNLAHSLQPGQSLVTIRTGDRAAEAESILKRNNGLAQEEPLSSQTGDDALQLKASAAGEDRLHLFGEVLRVHAERASRAATQP